MSNNLDQIFISDPITTNMSTDLMYFMRSPYTSGTDKAMTFANFAAQFSGVTPAQIQNQAFTYTFDAGSTNSYALTLTPALTTYSDGQVFDFTANNRNTGASTLNINGLGAVAIVLSNNTALVGSEILLNNSYSVIYNATIGKFILLNPSGTVVQNQTNTFAVDTGTANTYVVGYNPSVRYLKDGQFFSFKAVHANTGASTFNPDGFGATAIVTNANAALSGGEILAGGDYIVMYNSTFSKFVIINPTVSGGGGGGVTSTQVQQSAFNIGTDTGTVNLYQVALSPAISSYTDGLTVIFRPQNDNTSQGPQLQVNGLAPVVIVLPYSGASLQPGDLNVSNNSIAVCIYNAGTGLFELMTPFNSVMTTDQIQNVEANAVFDFNFSPNTYSGSTELLPRSFAGTQVPIYLFPSSTNTGASTLNVGGEGAFPIVLPDTSPLFGGEIINGNFYLILRANATQWVLLNPSVSSSVKLQTPTTGDTVTLPLGLMRTVLTPATTLAALTINLPDPSAGTAGYVLTVSTTQIITALTVAAPGTSVVAAPTTLTAGQAFTMVFNPGNNTWYPG